MPHTPLEQYQALTQAKKFIGAYPITLQRKHLANINMRDYAVRVKADGKRFLMFIPDASQGDAPYCYLIERGMKFTRLPFVQTAFANSIIDIEYIKENDTYVGLDLLFFKGKDLRGDPDYPFQVRLALLNEFVEAMHQYPKGEAPTFVLIETFFDNIKKAAEQLLVGNKNKHYEIDGLLFLPKAKPYPATKLWDSQYKWKPDEFNSIDFLLHKARQYDDHTVWHLLSRRKHEGSVLFEPFSPPDHPEIYIMPLPNGYADEAGVPFEEGRVAECVYDDAKGQFFPFRHRPDKNEDKRCNSLTTALDIWETIIHPVTQEMVMSRID